MDVSRPTGEVDFSTMRNPSAVDQIINRATAQATAVAALPIPVVDLLGVAYIQYRMVRRISEYYGQESDDNTQVVISSAISSVFGTLVSHFTDYLVDTTKMSRLIGEGIIKGTVAAFVTKMTGDVYTKYYQQGHSADDVSVGAYLDYMSASLDNGALVDSVFGTGRFGALFGNR